MKVLAAATRPRTVLITSQPPPPGVHHTVSRMASSTAAGLLVLSTNLDAAATTTPTEWFLENVVARQDSAEDRVDLPSAEFLRLAEGLASESSSRIHA